MGVRFVVRSRQGQPLPSELEFVFEQSRIVIGRGAASDVCIPDRTVSETHATVQQRGDDWTLADAGSTNGTKLNGQRLTGDRGRKLRDGDSLELGTYVLSFHLQPLVLEPMSAERTAELARRLLRQAHCAPGQRFAPPRLCVLSGPGTGSSFEIPAAPSRSLLGSADSCQLVLADMEVAREHAELIHDLDGILIKNLGSQNALVFGDQVVHSRRLRDGDELTLGQTRLLFEDPAQASLDALKAEPDLVYAPPVPPPAPEKTEPLGAVPVSVAARSASLPSKPARVDADLMIYALAGTVLLASIAALVMLFRAY
jgi:pSer/pThr/pTyr-binding forkhead associated (FHA) protein